MAADPVIVNQQEILANQRSILDNQTKLSKMLANQATMNTPGGVAFATMSEGSADKGSDGHDTRHRQAHGDPRL